VIAVRAGPASDGCVVIEDVGEESEEPEEDTAGLHLHVSLPRHSQGLSRDVTTKNIFMTVLSERLITSKMKDRLFDLVCAGPNGLLEITSLRPLGRVGIVGIFLTKAPEQNLVSVSASQYTYYYHHVPVFFLPEPLAGREL